MTQSRARQNIVETVTVSTIFWRARLCQFEFRKNNRHKLIINVFQWLYLINSNAPYLFRELLLYVKQIYRSFKIIKLTRTQHAPCTHALQSPACGSCKATVTVHIMCAYNYSVFQKANA